MDRDEEQVHRPDIEDVIMACRRILSEAGRNPDQAAAFVERIAPPERPTEKPLRIASTWHYAYLTRVMIQLQIWLEMSRDDQELIKSGVLEERVPWMGEPAAQYARVIDETIAMRNKGAKSYILSAKKALGMLGHG